jgi:hypothetical protein
MGPAAFRHGSGSEGGGEGGGDNGEERFFSPSTFITFHQFALLPMQCPPFPTLLFYPPFQTFSPPLHSFGHVFSLFANCFTLLPLNTFFPQLHIYAHFFRFAHHYAPFYPQLQSFNRHYTVHRLMPTASHFLSTA